MQRKPSDTENKLLLLHAIDRLGAVTAEQLLVFVVEQNLMDYIALQLCLAQLDEAGLLKKQAHPLGALYALTGKGRDSLLMFQARVPHSRLDRINQAADDWRHRFRREKQMPATFQKKPDGSYHVCLRLLEDDEELLSLNISVPTHANAQQFSDAWQVQATALYAQIMQSLGEDSAQ